MSGFIVRIWCRDCNGVDPLGCFDGGTELLTERDSDKPIVFATFEEADHAGYESEGGAPYDHEVTPFAQSAVEDVKE